MVIVTMRTQTLPLMRMKAGNSRKKIWDINKVHNKDSEWPSNIKSELLNLDRKQDITISKKNLKKMLQKILYWKAPGKDR